MLDEVPPFPDAIPCSGALELGGGVVAAGAPVVHVIVAVAPGSECTIPATSGVDAIVLALDGAATASADGTSINLERWDALRVPGLAVVLRTRTPGLTALLALATDSGDLATRLVERRAWTERPGVVHHVATDDTEELVWGGGGFRARIAFGAPDSPLVGLEVLRFAATQAIPPHEHESWEVITVLAGSGTMRVAEVDTAITPTMHVAIPPTIRHQAAAGAEDVVVVQSYSPAGAEQRFVKLAADARVK